LRSRRRSSWVGGAALLLACSPEVERGQSPLIGARNAESDQDPASVAVLATYGNQGQVFCSGVQILPDVILTAGHCVDTFAAARQQIGPSVRFWVSGASELSQVASGVVPADATEVVNEVAHPGWLASEDLWEDLGLLFLNQARFTTPLPSLVPIGAEVEVVPGLAVNVLGWGVDRDEVGQVSEQKRIAKVELRAVTGAYVGYGGPERGGTSVGCSGDSGGPVFAVQGDDRFVVAISSRSDCRVWTAALRPDRHRTFLRDTLAAACADGRRPACTQEQPTELPAARFPRASRRELPEAVARGIELGCAREVALCRDQPFPDGDECRIALSTPLLALDDPACTALLPAAVECLSCMANACYSTCAGCPDLIAQLFACVAQPLPPPPDAGVFEDLGSALEGEVDASEPDGGVIIDSGSDVDLGSEGVPKEEGGCRAIGTGGHPPVFGWVFLVLLGAGLRRKPRFAPGG
jgi:hypothetical protein